jgi:hypothetical protein
MAIATVWQFRANPLHHGDRLERVVILVKGVCEFVGYFYGLRVEERFGGSCEQPLISWRRIGSLMMMLLGLLVLGLAVAASRRIIHLKKKVPPFYLFNFL